MISCFIPYFESVIVKIKIIISSVISDPAISLTPMYSPLRISSTKKVFLKHMLGVTQLSALNYVGDGRKEYVLSAFSST